MNQRLTEAAAVMGHAARYSGSSEARDLSSLASDFDPPVCDACGWDHGDEPCQD